MPVLNKVHLEPRIRRLLVSGLRHHRAGRHEAARVYYRKTLKADPQCVQALHLLGLVALEKGQYAESAQWLSAVLALNPDEPQALHNLANAYLGQGETEKALGFYRRLLELQPTSAEAHYAMGRAQERLKDWGAAADSYRRALTFEPESAEYHIALARVLAKVGAREQAASFCQRAISLGPERPEVYDDLGRVLTDLGEYDAAHQAFRRALALRPDCAQAALDLGTLFERWGRLESAADWFRYALRANPKLKEAHLQLGTVLVGLGQLDEGEKCFERVRALDPASAESTFNLALVHLLEGKFTPGWSEYESRFEACDLDRRKLSQPLWRGEPLEGARILLYHEQGIGDGLQFVRYVPLVAARGGEVILETHPRLRRLFERTRGAWQVLSRDEPLPEFAWRCPLLSLPRAFGTELTTIPQEIPYIHPDPLLTEAWRERLRGDTLRIGLAWGGNPDHGRDHLRSIPLARLTPLLGIAGTTFYSLQIGSAAEQVKRLPSGARLIDLVAEQKDLADAAAIVANLDLVISIDSALAHLAGAMGKPVWVLLSSSPDWRWLLGREDSPWYPTARLFRQPALGAWGEVVNRLERELRLVALGLRPLGQDLNQGKGARFGAILGAPEGGQ